LGIEGKRYPKTVQKHCCRLAAETSFASTSEHLQERLGVDLCPQTVRTMVEGHGQAMARFQAEDSVRAQAFSVAAGVVEFTTDAGKVHTREEGWKDLKIARVSKREAGKPCTPDDGRQQRWPATTFVLAFAMIATAQTFRKRWRPWLRRLGVTAWADVQVLADGVSWIGKAVGRALTGCVQTLDFFHACGHVRKCGERIFGEETSEGGSVYQRGRVLLAWQGWAGIGQWASELLGVADEAERERRRRPREGMLGSFAKQTPRCSVEILCSSQ
jgi:hypothetical protein